MGLEQWTVAGRGFGGLFVFLLTAGEIYTTFTFLGGSGWAYGRGAPAYLHPRLRLARLLSCPTSCCRRSGATPSASALLSQPDFFARKYDSPWLGRARRRRRRRGAGALPGAAVHRASASSSRSLPTARSRRRVAIWIGAATVTIYVMVSGMHGAAWNAAVKDMLILLVVVFLGIYLPLHYYGGFGEMFQAIDAAKPGFLGLQADRRERAVVPIDGRC